MPQEAPDTRSKFGSVGTKCHIVVSVPFFVSRVREREKTDMWSLRRNFYISPLKLFCDYINFDIFCQIGHLLCFFYFSPK